VSDYVSVEMNGDGAGGTLRICHGSASESGRAGIVVYGDPNLGATVNQGKIYGPPMVEMGELSDGTYGLAAVNPAGQMVKLAQLVFGPDAKADSSSGTRTGMTAFNLGDLTGADVGPSVTVNIGDTGKALVFFTANTYMTVNDNGGAAFANVSITGATTKEVGVAGIQFQPNVGQTLFVSSNIGRHALVTGLNPGVHTFTMKYAAWTLTGLVNQTATFQSRDIAVFPY